MPVSLLRAFALFILASGTALASDKPNILLITADDLGLQLSCYGDTIAQTPNLDALAKHSVRFETAYVSQASCSPSRSTMFTGMYPHGNGQYGLANANVGFQVHRELHNDLLPNVLKREGYATGIIGKLHVNPEQSFQFDFRQKEGFGSREVEKQIGFAKDFVDQAGEQPWFLMFNLFDPHVARARKPNGQRGASYFPDQVEGLPKSLLTADDVKPWPWQQISTPKQLEQIAGYYNCVQRIDAAIGMLTDLLRETNQWDTTVIVFLGDHGPPFARGKTSCYEAGLRVPFIVRWPGVSVPHVSERLVGSVDIYPSILDAAGVESMPQLHGRSLRPVLTNAKENDWRTTLVAEFHYHGAFPFFPRRAITDGRFKLIHNLLANQRSAIASVDGDQAHVFARMLPPEHRARQAIERLENPPEWELYDLQRDPVEFVNLAGDAGFVEQADRLRRALRAWQTKTNDPFVDATFRAKVESRYRKQ